MPNRRDFLRNLTASAGGLLFVACGLESVSLSAAQVGKRREVRIGGRRVRTIDVHAHCYSADVWSLVKDRKESSLMRGILDRQADEFYLGKNNLDQRLSQMDALGVDMQALSPAPELHYWAERDLAERIVEVENEQIAAVCAAYPDRFTAIGGLALHIPELAVTQLQQGVKKFAMRGFVIGGSVNGDELSDAKFHPVWAKAEELGAVMFIHPRGFPEGEKR